MKGVLWVMILVAVGSGQVCNDLLDAAHVLSVTPSSNCTTDSTSFLQQRLRNLKREDALNATTSICFSSSSDPGNSVNLLTSRSFLVRRLEFWPTSNSTKDLVSEVRMATTDSNGPQWYVSPSDRDSSAEWSVLKASHGEVSLIPDALSFSNVTLWVMGPKSVDNNPLPMNGSVAFYGCWQEDTQTVDYLFNRTITSVQQSFAALGFFEEIIAGLITNANKIFNKDIDPSRISVKTVPAGPQGTALRITVLPDASSNTTVSDIAEYLTSNSDILNAMSNIQEILVNEAQLCYDKVCPMGSMCVNGKCVTKKGESFGAFPKPTSNTLSTSIYTNPIQATESSSSSTSSSVSRYIVPLSIAGAVMLVILILLVRQWMKRRYGGHSD